MFKLCMSKIQHLEIYMFLLNIVFFVNEGKEEWKGNILKKLFHSILDKDDQMGAQMA